MIRALRPAAFAALALSVATLAGAPALAAGVKVGAKAPEFTAVDSNGMTVRLADFRGKLVVLEWSNHDCPYVRKHYRAGNMQSQQDAAAKAGIVWLTIISSAEGEQGHVSGAKANALTAERKAKPAHVLFDPAGTIGRAYDAKVTPHMYVIGKDGTLLFQGGIDSIASTRDADIERAKQYVREALAEIASGKPVTDHTTRAYGCTIKYKPGA